MVFSFNNRQCLILGSCIFLGLSALGLLLGSSALRYREFERVVSVKGLSEREYPADTVIWPLEFSVVDNDLQNLHASLDQQTATLRRFLLDAGIAAEAVSAGMPSVQDRFTMQYRQNEQPLFRYMASRQLTVYSDQVELVRSVMTQLGEVGSSGVVLNGESWRQNPQYLFTRLNQVKPDMVEEATRNAREVAMKFAEDSQSRLGRIRRASQGQFSISSRDANNPHIKTVRVVSTVEYYLSD